MVRSVDASARLVVSADSMHKARSRRARPGNSRTRVSVSGLNLPTALKFLPDGHLLVLELGGTIRKVHPDNWSVEPRSVPGSDEHRHRQRATGPYGHGPGSGLRNEPVLYVFYTLGTPNRDRVSRFTAKADLLPGGTPAASSSSTRVRRTAAELKLRERRQALRHDRRALRCQTLGAVPRQPAQQAPEVRVRARGQSLVRQHASTPSGPWACAIPSAPSTTAPPGGSTSRTWAETTTPRRRKSTPERAARTTAGPSVKDSPVERSHLHEPDLCLRPQREGCVDNRRLHLPGQPVPRAVPGELLLRRLRPELDQAADLRRARERRHRRVQLRAGDGGSDGPVRRHRLPHRGARTARCTTSTSATPTRAARSAISKIRRIRYLESATSRPRAVVHGRPARRAGRLWQ